MKFGFNETSYGRFGPAVAVVCRMLSWLSLAQRKIFNIGGFEHVWDLFHVFYPTSVTITSQNQSVIVVHLHIKLLKVFFHLYQSFWLQHLTFVKEPAHNIF